MGGATITYLCRGCATHHKRSKASPDVSRVSRIPPGSPTSCCAPRYYSHGFPVCGHAAARSDVVTSVAGDVVSPVFRSWGWCDCGGEPGAVVVPAGRGLLAPAADGPAQGEGEAGAGDQPGGVLSGETGGPGGLGDRQPDGGDARRAGLADGGDGRVAEGNRQVSVVHVVAAVRGGAFACVAWANCYQPAHCDALLAGECSMC
jgi:hypothetical protein